MSQQINDIIQRTYRYFYVDGLAEIASGGMFILVGSWLVVMALVEPGTLAVGIAALGLPVVILGGTFLLNRAVRNLKERYTFPRTGYVAYRHEKKDSKRWILIGIALLLPFLLMFLPESWNELPLVIGGILGVVLVYIGYRMGVSRFYLPGGAAVLLGVLCSLFVQNETLGAGLTFLGTGLLLAASGGLVLRGYLQEHPMQNEAAG
jgi:hypothetical protein